MILKLVFVSSNTISQIAHFITISIFLLKVWIFSTRVITISIFLLKVWIFSTRGEHICLKLQYFAR